MLNVLKKRKNGKLIFTYYFKKDSVEPRKQFVYDEWCKEIEQHPAFMTNLHPDENGEFSEAVQALQV